MGSTPCDPLLTRVAEAFGPDGRLRVTVEGESMCPTLKPGDRVVVEPLSGRPPERGEVVVVRSRGQHPAVHRVIARRRRKGMWLIATMGDAMAHLDPLVYESDLLGRVVSVERQGEKAPIAQREASFGNLLRAHWELLLHGRVGERHPLRSVPRTLARLLRTLSGRSRANQEPAAYRDTEKDAEGTDPPERTTSTTA